MYISYNIRYHKHIYCIKNQYFTKH